MTSAPRIVKSPSTVSRFGSFGMEYERPDSDLDLAVYAGRPLPAVRLRRLAQELATEAGRDVDYELSQFASFLPTLRFTYPNRPVVDSLERR